MHTGSLIQDLLAAVEKVQEAAKQRGTQQRQTSAPEPPESDHLLEKEILQTE